MENRERVFFFFFPSVGEIAYRLVRFVVASSMFKSLFWSKGVLSCCVYGCENYQALNLWVESRWFFTSMEISKCTWNPKVFVFGLPIVFKNSNYFNLMSAFPLVLLKGSLTLTS